MPIYTYATLNDPLAGSGGTFAVGINNEGQITGYYFDSNGAAHGFLYSGGTWTTLNDPFATNGTFAEGINNKGQIVGYYVDATGDHGFLYSGGTYTTLNDTAANSGTTQAFGINDLGQIVGGFTDANGDHGFLYSGGSYTTLDAGPSTPAGYRPSPFGPSFGATGTVAYGINDAGQIVGQNTFLMFNVSQDAIASEGFLYTDGAFTTVNPPWDTTKRLLDTVFSSYAGGINGLGQIVGGPGFSNFEGPGFVYSFGPYTALDDPGAVDHETNPFGINAEGAIVGYYITASNSADAFVAIPTNLGSPAGTTADVILRDAVNNAFGILDVGNNSTLASSPLGQIGPEWQFAGLGGFQTGDTSDMLLRNLNSGGLEVYDISNNEITSATALGAVGLNWQVAGFGNFSSLGETDMIMRNGSAFEVYDIRNNRITDALPLGDIGTEWQIAGFDNHGSETDMVLRNSNSGALEIYDINNNQISSASLLGVVGLEWQVVGFGDFSSRPGEGDMMMENTNTGALEIYDINNDHISYANFVGSLNAPAQQIVGFGPFSGTDQSDMLVRNNANGQAVVCDIANNQIGEEAGVAQDLSAQLQIVGVATDSSAVSAASTAQLVQTMAGFGGDSGAGESLNAAPLGADTSQQPLLTTPQHS